MNFLHHLAHLAGAALAAVGLTVSPVHPAVSAGMQAGPVCITQTAHPGGSYTAPVSVVGSGNLHLSVQQIGPPAGPPYPAGGHPLPASWVSFSGVTQVTVSVPADAKPGRYGASLVVTNYGSGGGGSGTHVALGAASATWLEVSVNVSPPPRAFCTGQRDTYWPPALRLPWCKPGQAPRLSVAVPVCRVKPLPPPVVSARNCGMTQAAWRQYMNQLRLAGQRYAHNRSAYLYAAHCSVHGQQLNTPAYYHRQGIYRWPDAPARYR